MKSIQSKIILIFGCSLFIAGCEQSTNWDISPQSDQKIVVQAILTDEIKTQVIILSQTYSALNENAPPVDGASVIVQSNNIS